MSRSKPRNICQPIQLTNCVARSTRKRSPAKLTLRGPGRSSRSRSCAPGGRRRVDHASGSSPSRGSWSGRRGRRLSVLFFQAAMKSAVDEKTWWLYTILSTLNCDGSEPETSMYWKNEIGWIHGCKGGEQAVSRPPERATHAGDVAPPRHPAAPEGAVERERAGHARDERVVRHAEHRRAKQVLRCPLAPHPHGAHEPHTCVTGASGVMRLRKSVLISAMFTNPRALNGISGRW
jgi:hypothetical protein